MKKKYGIWGLGVVGKSVLQFLHARSKEYNVSQLLVMDKRKPSKEEVRFLESSGISYISEQEQNHFFAQSDVIIPSPGVDTRSIVDHRHKIVEEIDLFFDAWHRSIIAVTGTVGKTSIVHLLSTILQHNHLNLVTGGNIGMGMLDIVNSKADYALLELSSFQLEHAQRFTPDLAILTNLYPNHLDRHETVNSYLQAKYKIMQHQNASQKALVPWKLRNELRALRDRPYHFFSTGLVEGKLGPQDILYILHNQEIRKITRDTDVSLFNLVDLSTVSYKENWLIILAACDMLGLLNKTFTLPPLHLPSHRLEKIDTIAGITFYNDSKSTIPESTLAAVEHLSPARIHLFLGGLSKGVDRSLTIANLRGKVASVACFGKESEALSKACKEANIPAQRYADLNDAFKAEKAQWKCHDVVLFSPSGSSFDLYKDYKERGHAFIQLVSEFKEERGL